jgi:hypothetical protein
MAISGSAKPSVPMRLIDGRLETGIYALRQSVENDPAKAARRILAGEVCFVQCYGGLIEQVRGEVLAVLDARESE